MLEKVKLALRIKSSVFDDEVSDLIAAARADLQLAGVLAVKVNNDADPLIRRAVVVYCKSEFGADNPDAERLKESYNMLKAHLTLSAEYTVGETV